MSEKIELERLPVGKLPSSYCGECRRGRRSRIRACCWRRHARPHEGGLAGAPWELAEAGIPCTDIGPVEADAVAVYAGAAPMPRPARDALAALFSR